ncbi:hypothetical protein F7725_008112 [Dissostichus mawsoni]|uniref:Uncharacterized protein n=1 Tax=Dissostichus mawsoni TaxID=36200 RepID=A0A7J5Y882_DISMA|nr:hypothetical protein F7725_008112 [Dissostichus mawsoni]
MTEGSLVGDEAAFSARFGQHHGFSHFAHLLQVLHAHLHEALALQADKLSQYSVEDAMDSSCCLSTSSKALSVASRVSIATRVSSAVSRARSIQSCSGSTLSAIFAPLHGAYAVQSDAAFMGCRNIDVWCELHLQDPKTSWERGRLDLIWSRSTMGKSKQTGNHKSDSKKNIAKTWKTKRRTKDLDEIHSDMKTEAAAKLLNQEVDVDEIFCDMRSMKEHFKTKVEKAQRGALHPAEAERAAGMASYTPQKTVEVKTQTVEEDMD